MSIKSICIIVPMVCFLGYNTMAFSETGELQQQEAYMSEAKCVSDAPEKFPASKYRDFEIFYLPGGKQLVEDGSNLFEAMILTKSIVTDENGSPLYSTNIAFRNLKLIYEVNESGILVFKELRHAFKFFEDKSVTETIQFDGNEGKLLIRIESLENGSVEELQYTVRCQHNRFQ